MPPRLLEACLALLDAVQTPWGSDTEHTSLRSAHFGINVIRLEFSGGVCAQAEGELVPSSFSKSILDGCVELWRAGREAAVLLPPVCGRFLSCRTVLVMPDALRVEYGHEMHFFAGSPIFAESPRATCASRWHSETDEQEDKSPTSEKTRTNIKQHTIKCQRRASGLT